MWMDLLKVFLTSIASIITIFFITKIHGNKQISELNMFDYINGITIGSIAAEMATSLEEVLKPLVALVVYSIVATLLTVISDKSIKARNFFDGVPIVLYDNNMLYNENLKKAKINTNEFLTQCRKSGYFDLSKIQTAIMETNGNISFLPKSEERPLTPRDMNLQVNKEEVVVNVVMDGKIMWDCLKYTGNDEKWLKENLRKQGASQISEVFLAICDRDNNLTVYKRIDEKVDKNVFS